MPQAFTRRFDMRQIGRAEFLNQIRALDSQADQELGGPTERRYRSQGTETIVEWVRAGPLVLTDAPQSPNTTQGLGQFDRQLAQAVDQVNAHMADKPKPRQNVALLARVLNSTGREGDDEAGALIKRRQKNHARLLGLIAKGHGNEKLREATFDEAEREAELDDLEAALKSNGGPTLQEPESQDVEKAREGLAAAKSSAQS